MTELDKNAMDDHDDTDGWQRCAAPLIPRRTIDGGWTSSLGQTWRRKRDGKWEYRQEEEPPDDWVDRHTMGL